MTLLGISISIASFISAFVFLSLYEHDKCNWQKITPGILLYIFAAILLPYLRISGLHNTYLLVSECALCGYIAFSAWTDMCDKYIYALPFTVLLIIYALSKIVASGDIWIIICPVIIIAVLYFGCCVIGNMGKGDMFVIAAICLMIADVYRILVCIAVSSVIFILSNLRNINWHKMNLNEGQAFIPALSAGLTLTIMIL